MKTRKRVSTASDRSQRLDKVGHKEGNGTLSVPGMVWYSMVWYSVIPVLIRNDSFSGAEEGERLGVGKSSNERVGEGSRR